MNKKKVYFFLLINFLFVDIILSQKYDFNWLIGFRDGPKRDSVIGNTMMIFNTTSGNLEYKFDKSKNISFDGGNALSLSDFNGNYLLSFNGYFIEDSLGVKVNNSDSICPYYEQCWIVGQSSIFIPDEYSKNEYYLFSLHMNEYSLRGNLLSYTKVEISQSGIVALQDMKTILLKDTIDSGRLMACKHANGKDWWLIAFKDSVNTYYNILIDRKGPKIINKNKINESIRMNGFGYATFSNNGKYYANYISEDNIISPVRILDFYEFDRCNGLLSHHQSRISISLKNDGDGSEVGCAFSPDSKLLYICESDSLFQFPISEDGVLGERVLIDVYDGFRSYLYNNITKPTKFRQLQLAPDGKIYCNPTWIDTREFGVINKPNNPGKACDFRQHNLRMPALKYTSPSFPNYRLGPIDGSSCDTLGIDNIPWCWWRYDQDTSKSLCFEFTDLSAYEVAEWYWDFGDGSQSRDTSPIHCYNQNGVYEVCLIVENQFGADTLCRTLNIGVNGTKNKKNEEIQTELFPNPASNYFVLNIQDYIPEYMLLHLLNSQGKEVLKQRVFQGSNVIDLEVIPSGLYLVLLKDRKGMMKTEKLVIE